MLGVTTLRVTSGAMRRNKAISEPEEVSLATETRNHVEQSYLLSTCSFFSIIANDGDPAEPQVPASRRP